MSRSRAQLLTEATGTALLLVAMVGSGLSGEKLGAAPGGSSLLIHGLAVGLIFLSLIAAFGQGSAHFNPAVSLYFALKRELPFSALPKHLLGQFIGALIGVILTHLMFGVDLVEMGQRVRWGPRLWLSEFIATFGLLVVLQGSLRHGRRALACALGAYLTAAICSFPSEGFVNPAATVARSLTDGFTSLRPHDVLPLCLSQIVAAFVAASFMRIAEGATLETAD